MALGTKLGDHHHVGTVVSLEVDQQLGEVPALLICVQLPDRAHSLFLREAHDRAKEQTHPRAEARNPFAESTLDQKLGVHGSEA
jgi:hypothetical protein